MRIAALRSGYLTPPPKELVRAPRKQVRMPDLILLFLCGVCCFALTRAAQSCEGASWGVAPHQGMLAAALVAGILCACASSGGSCRQAAF